MKPPPAISFSKDNDLSHQLDAAPTRLTNDSSNLTYDSKKHEKTVHSLNGQTNSSVDMRLPAVIQRNENKKQLKFNGPNMHTSRRTELDHNNKIKPFTGGGGDKLLFTGTTHAAGDKPSINDESKADKDLISIAGSGDTPSLFRPVADKAFFGSHGDNSSSNSSSSIGVGKMEKPTPFLSIRGGKSLPSLLKGSPFLEKALGVSSSVDTSVESVVTPLPDYHRTMPPDLADSLTSSLDSIAWNLDGTQTIIENGSRTSTKSSTPINEESRDETTLFEELRKLREENKQLKKSVDEAAAVNCAWRKFHEDRQNYVQRLLMTIHELQHASNKKHSSSNDQEDAGADGIGDHTNDTDLGASAETRKLREELARLQVEHHEHVTLLEMQVRAHRDDWEAERSDKKAAQTALEETEARAAMLLQELQLLQAKLTDSEVKCDTCWRCSVSRTEDGTTKSRTNSSSSTSNSSHVSPVPLNDDKFCLCSFYDE
ncbi:unnamed protein product, partial [Meganyctiphanes norvegica]